MVPKEIQDRVLAEVRRHCQAKGYWEGPGVNNFVPHDAVAALAMARSLTSSGLFDHYFAVAPEGHIYGYFFERLGAKVLSVFMDYPPSRCESADDLSVLTGGRVLLIEDDVIGGGTLRLVVAHLRRCSPASLAVYLGHTWGRPASAERPQGDHGRLPGRGPPGLAEQGGRRGGGHRVLREALELIS